jgi:phage gp46-like protein
VTGDKHGSRLWLLARQNVTARTIQRAKEYTEEALQWMVDDGVCATFEVIVERFGRNGIAVGVVLYRADRRVLADLRFSDVWGAINA